ncbi:DUF6146 family protein [Maribacter sp. SA7]|uniref:DUF6146 family protein n=1 Tax=Maribacter zhoushanensis TaxID=3030012 RepID=UPI0023EDB35B|nr:DUF6146 family protein [Maribacter zhoushanensis]MDF4203199.1 DUF6146 family protein [Maribacter zhoushanensis]
MKKTYLLFHNLLLLTVLVSFMVSCGSTKESLAISSDEEQAFKQVQGDTITISSDKTEYEIIIIEPGFNVWLSSIAKPEGYYSQSFLENRNYIMVLEWNNRVLQPSRFDPNLYELQINYSSQIDYGYEVNYKLYNYFIYFQRKYNQRLGPFVPRI